MAEDLIATYAAQRERVERMEADLARARTQVQQTLKRLLKEHGPGPHRLDGRNVVLRTDGYTVMLVPA